MTCLAQGSMVEVFITSSLLDVALVSVERLRPDMITRDALTGAPVRISDVIFQRTSGRWPLYSYLGVNADASQWIYTPADGWVRLSDVGSHSVSPCDEIVAVRLYGGNSMLVGGVVCMTLS